MSLSSNSITSLRHLLFLLEHACKVKRIRIEEVSKAEVLLAKIGQLGVDSFQDDEYTALKPGLKMLDPLRELYGSEPKPVRRETIDGFFRGMRAGGDIFFVAMWCDVMCLCLCVRYCSVYEDVGGCIGESGEVKILLFRSVCKVWRGD
jgi:hypothetical protein